MEKDDEMKGTGNSYDFGARIYDARLGYFLSIDPLTRKYASQSPYVYAANSPLRYIDLHGMGPADAAKSGMSAATAAASNKSGQSSNSGSGNANTKQPKSATQWVKTIATTANQKSQTASNNTASNNTANNNASNNTKSNTTTSNTTTSQSLSQRVTNIITENTPTGTSSSASNNTSVALTGNETPAQSNTMPWTGETTSASVTTYSKDFGIEPLGGVSVQSTTTTVVDGETGVFNYNKTTNEKGEISHDVSLNTPISSTTIGTNGSGLNVSQTYFGYGGSQGIGITENYSLEVSFGLIWPNENGSSQETSVSFRANPVVVASIVFAPYAGGLGASLARLVTR